MCYMMRHQKFFACLKHVFVLVKLNLSPFFEPSPLHFELQCFQGAGADACCGIEQLKNHVSQLHTATQRTWSRAESWQTSMDTIWQDVPARLGSHNPMHYSMRRPKVFTCLNMCYHVFILSELSLSPSLSLSHYILSIKFVNLSPI